MSSQAAHTRERAALIEHEWDARALEWPLTPTSVVVEVGGFTGRWALQIAERYAPRLFVFEPQEWAAKVCCEVLGTRAQVLGYGLGTSDTTLPMAHYDTDGATFIEGNGPWGDIREIGYVLRGLVLDHIDLMLINIEGYEYTLIPHMLQQGIIPERLMVQMHNFAGNSAELRARLAVHYRLLWDYGDVLSAWGRESAV